jgi:hypothetical protein
MLANNGGKLNIVFENWGLEQQDPENYLDNRQKLIEEMYIQIQEFATHTPAYEDAKTEEEKAAAVKRIKDAVNFQSLDDIKQEMSDDLVEIEKKTIESPEYKNAGTEEKKRKILDEMKYTIFVKRKSEYDEEKKYAMLKHGSDFSYSKFNSDLAFNNTISL